ncbi:hypothetical protein RvY_17020 [Ramazzottius varieornatus]|uniref:Uncharacterized protein n=1 Tax=Ramazzottius varieornatus TaxID=947166 RepID=A0A1D1W0M3_RAMVA|nr:hypothetical protein RvY_17020 [Ramazzottius varieornatus]
MAPAVILSTVSLLMLCYAALASAEDPVPLRTSATGVPRAVCKEKAPFIIGAHTVTEVSLLWYYFDGRTVKNTKP